MKTVNMKSSIPAIVYVKGLAIKSLGQAAVRNTHGRGRVTPKKSEKNKKNKKNKKIKK